MRENKRRRETKTQGIHGTFGVVHTYSIFEDIFGMKEAVKHTVEHQPIAILDSGVGGLTVVKQVMAQLPDETLYYFGDTARTPYGPRPPQQVLTFTIEIVDFLLQFRPKLLVIACNTATAVARDMVQQRTSIPVLGVIFPGAKAAVQATKRRHIGVIGTEGTIRSRAYETVMQQLDPTVVVQSLSCPAFVPLVEQGQFHTHHAQRIVEDTLHPMRQYPIDTLILGCTHYPFLTPLIQQSMGPSVQLISSAAQTAQDVRLHLEQTKTRTPSHDAHILESRTTVRSNHRFFCSGDPNSFQTIAQGWLEFPVHVESCPQFSQGVHTLE